MVKMIQYALKCNADHKFDSWFQSASAFDKLQLAKMVTCPVCGSSQIEKSIMSPRVGPRSNKKTDVTPSLKTPETDAEKALMALRKHVETNAQYVGGNFADEARAMHDGTSPERAIYGEAQPEQARALIDEGIPVAPLPFAPTRKAN